MRVLVTGATGFVGKPLVKKFIEEGHQVTAVSRGRRPDRKIGAACQSLVWDYTKGDFPVEALQGIDAVVNLAGEPLMKGRWNNEKKSLIYQSRVLTTQKLVKAINQCEKKPKVMVSCSAIGFYGDRGDEDLTVESAPGDTFTSKVCADWEKPVKDQLDDTVRKVIIRTGVVLGIEGGTLKRMLPLFNLGLGGRLGSGDQWFSWIHLTDLVNQFFEATTNAIVQGVFNGVSPFPVTNREFTEKFSECTGKPAFMTVPEFALKLAMGEMAQVPLSSQKVHPTRWEQIDFPYRFPKVKAALIELLSRPRN